MAKLLHHLASLVVIVLYTSTTIVAQQKIGSSLQSALQSDPATDYRVTVYMNEKADLAALKSDLKENQVPVKDRPLLVKNALKMVADRTQLAMLNELAAEFDIEQHHLNAKRLWINNCMVIWADAGMIQFMAESEQVDLVDLESARRIKLLDPPRRVNFGGAREPGSAEPGLLSIGAHHLWNLGYTGNNRISYSIDTGVWPDHPAIDDQFMANYVPLNQAWFGYDSELPADKSSDHGTHTIGTTLGLDQNTQDTIGVAFGAYYIASDPVATSLATVKPLTDFMFAFEWAFDPDGDSTTTHDIPDVINNSWGYDVPVDDELCDSYASEMFTAIETAGIANVMSAGNDGPGVMTIGIPHHINTGLVNTFTVGAVNAHSASLPIANFSSRGPTICGGTGSLEIKPEVVAPGVAVRSAIRDGEYDDYQGTSMAAPHVSGAVLLLREAFPNVDGEEILLALYYSAQDLGDVGEDNSYGNGMINVLEAFNYLSLSHTPTPPDSTSLDLAVTDITNPELDLICGETFTPQIQLSNLGNEVITDVSITYSIVGESDQSYLWSGTLQPGNDETVVLDPITVSSSGTVELWVRSEVVGSPSEADIINNNRVKRINIRPTRSVPFYEQYEDGQLFDGTWLVRNPDAHITWDTLVTGGLNWSQYSVQVDFRHYNPKAGQKDELISPLITMPATDIAVLKFDMSYSFYHTSFADSVEVLISTDCGITWVSEYYKGGEELGLEDSITEGSNSFLPTLPDHWRTETIDLDNYVGDEILVCFRSTNYRGSHFVLDNVRIFTETDPASLEENQVPEFVIFPNPASSKLSLRSKSEFVADLVITDLQGRRLKQLNNLKLTTNGIQIDVSDLKSGSYVVGLNAGANKLVRPLVIAR